MLVFNQQANIKNVNGAIADVFANRPAPQSTFYLFYSTDTQEIFYDNGAWILLGTGGGGVNIYNSNGTLTGQRTIDCNGQIIDFITARSFSAQSVDFTPYSKINSFTINARLNFLSLATLNGITNKVYGIYQTSYIRNNINNFVLGVGNINDRNLLFDYANDIIGVNVTNVQNNVTRIYRGIKLDFANQSYSLGDPDNYAGGNYFVINDANGRITTGNNAGVNGIDIDFATGISNFGYINDANPTYYFVQSGLIQTIYSGAAQGFRLDFTIENYEFGNGAIGNQTNFVLNDPNSIIKSVYQGNDTGLKLDFANKEYWLGDNTQLGFYINVNTQELFIGDIGNVYGGTTLKLDFSSSNGYILTRFNNNDIGLKLDFANGQYFLGDFAGISNNNQLFIDNNNYIFLGKTQNIGIEINNNFNTIYFGDYAGVNNNTNFLINDTNQLIKTTSGGNDIGLKLDFANKVYQFGHLTGGNTTYFKIDDVATFPLQLNGTNIKSNTSGGNSGQHLKVKINGVDYKIKLENP